MAIDTDRLEIGWIRRAHGLRGMLRVQLHDPASPALEALRSVQVGAAPPRSYEIEKLQDLGGGAYLMQLAGVTDRDEAEALRGLALAALRSELPALAKDEYYIGDLVGCLVMTTSGEAVGTVRAVPCVSGQDMLEVERPGRKEALVPLLPVFVTAVDLPGRRVEIDPPEGLLDLDLSAKPAAGAKDRGL